MLGGVILWIFGRSANHIGASALISGLIAFLILGGFFERRPVPIVVAVLTFFLYGGFADLGNYSELQRGVVGTVTCAARSPVVCLPFNWHGREAAG